MPNDHVPAGWPSPEVQLLSELKELKTQVSALTDQVHGISTQVEILKTKAAQWAAVVVVLGNIIGPIIIWALNSAKSGGAPAP